MGEHEAHFERLERAVALEAEAARNDPSLGSLSDRQLVSSGLGLSGLKVVEDAAAFGELRHLVLDGPHAQGHALRVGQPVRMWASGERDGPGVPGVIVRRGPPLVVSAPVESDPPQVNLRIEPVPDETTARRVLADLRQARAARGRLADLAAVLTGARSASISSYEGWLPHDLDDHQRRAARRAMGARDVALVHGPPGTGKTRTLVGIIRAAVRGGESVLVLAPSHTAVDNVAARLAAHGLDLVRLGHPARVAPALIDHTLDARLEKHERVRLARRYRREAADRFRQADRFTRARPAPGEKAAARREARALRADARKLEAQAAESLIDGADVVLATLGVDPALLGPRRFDLVVVDEAAQASEASTWRAAVRAGRLILGGDHRQLPATVRSRAAQDAGLGVSLFERLMEIAPEVGTRIDRQYRMHAELMAYPSASMYEGGLIADPTVASHLLADLEGVEAAAVTAQPLRVIDSAGAGFDEEQPAGETASRTNTKEAALLIEQVIGWLDAGLDSEQVGVITPYAAQARLLEERLGPLGVEVDTVDGFQGREKEAIAISLVRSNPEGQVGFLSDHRRMNVALTRARRALLVIGDGATLAAVPYFADFFRHAQDAGALQSVWEIPGAV